MSNLYLIRHGQSVYNLENRFTGWLNVELTTKGIEEAKDAAKNLKKFSLPEIAFTSKLIRAQKTLEIILEELDLKIPIIESEKLNERNYGDLQGENKDEMREKFGKEQVHLWRRSFETQPPNGESLKDTCERTIPYFEENIIKNLKNNKDVVIVAHGNSLRSILKQIESLDGDEVVKLEVKTGQVIAYKFNKTNNSFSKLISN